jgi:uncharacterized membrane protein
MAYDPISDKMSTIQDKIDKYKMIPRYAVLFTSAVFLYALIENLDLEKIKFTGYLFAIIVVMYTLGVDFIKEMVDYALKNKLLTTQTTEKISAVLDQTSNTLDKVDVVVNKTESTIDNIKEKL